MLTIAGLADVLRTAPAVAPAAMAAAGPEAEVIAVSAMKQGMTDGVSPDGTPFQPLAFPRPQGGDKPLLNEGILRASLAAMATADSLTLTANAPGARVHQWGATIVPVRAKALAIPMSKQAVYAGSPRNFGPGLFRMGGALVTRAEKVGKRGKYGTRVREKVTMHYILKQRVVIPARKYIGLSKDAVANISYAFARHAIRLLVEKGNGGGKA